MLLISITTGLKLCNVAETHGTFCQNHSALYTFPFSSASNGKNWWDIYSSLDRCRCKEIVDVTHFLFQKYSFNDSNTITLNSSQARNDHCLKLVWPLSLLNHYGRSALERICLTLSFTTQVSVSPVSFSTEYWKYSEMLMLTEIFWIWISSDLPVEMKMNWKSYNSQWRRQASLITVIH